MVANATEQCQTMINQMVQKAIEGTIEILLDELYDIIEKDVYSYQTNTDPNGNYSGRTGEFKESWKSTKAEIIGNYVSATISQNFDVFSIINSEWQHSDPWSSLMPNVLNQIIEDGLSDSNFGFPAIQSRPFWSGFEKYVQSNIGNIFIAQCNKVGLQIKRGTVDYTIS